MVLTPKSIDCAKARDLMFDYIDGALGERESVQLEFHISSCENCRAELEERRKLLNSIGNAEYSVPPTLHQSVMDKIADIPQENPGKPMLRFKPWMSTLTAACAAVMILIVAVGYLSLGSNRKADEAKDAAENMAEQMSPSIIAADEAPAKIADADNSLSPLEDAVVSETSPLDVILSDVSRENNAVIVCRKGDFGDDIPGERAGEILVNGVCYERYVVSEGAMAAFTSCAERLAAQSVDYRAVLLSGDQVDMFELYLLAE